MATCPTPASSSDAAAWVQAWGSIGAIVFSVLVAWWQMNRARKQTLYAIEQQRKADNLRMANTLLEIAKSALKLQKHVTGKLDSREKIHFAAQDNRLPFDMPMVYTMERQLDRIALHDLPANLIAPALLIAETFRQVKIKLEIVFDTHRKMDAAMFEDFFATVKSMEESMSATIADLENQLEQMR